MTREEHNKIIQQMIGLVAPDNQATASELLTQLSEDYEETLTNVETATNNVAELTAKNETLRDVNAKLFLKVGTTENKNQPPENNKPNIQEDEDKMTFEALFNEKGELI